MTLKIHHLQLTLDQHFNGEAHFMHSTLKSRNFQSWNVENLRESLLHDPKVTAWYAVISTASISFKMKKRKLSQSYV
jgi:hypothetical protein